MEWLVGLLSSAAGGGVLGLFGSLIGGGMKFLQAWQKQKEDREKRAHELKLLEIEMQRQRIEDEHELAIVSQKGAWQGLSDSLQSDAAISGADTYRWSKTIKELYRPFFTSALFVMVWFIFDSLMAVLTAGDSMLATIFSKAEAKDLIIYIVQSVVFTAATAGVWWFGDRAFAPPGMKNR